MKKLLLLLAIVLPTMLSAQETTGTLLNSNFHIGLDLQTKYVWRGMEMMTEDAAPVIFPQINYQSKGGQWYVYAMGATAINGKYSEVDLGASYTYKWVTIGINDYYYPTTTTADDKYFNLRNRDTGHWWEGLITVSPETLPVSLTVSTFFAGADKKSDGKQAYSTYAEIGGHYDFAGNHNIAMAVGAAFNKSCYNDYAHHFGVCNIELKYTYNVELKKNTLPLSVAYIINPIKEKSHINFLASFAF